MNRKNRKSRFKQEDELSLVHKEWDMLLRQGERVSRRLDTVVSVWNRSLWDEAEMGSHKMWALLALGNYGRPWVGLHLCRESVESEGKVQRQGSLGKHQHFKGRRGRRLWAEHAAEQQQGQRRTGKDLTWVESIKEVQVNRIRDMSALMRQITKTCTEQSGKLSIQLKLKLSILLKFCDGYLEVHYTILSTFMDIWIVHICKVTSLKYPLD